MSNVLDKYVAEAKQQTDPKRAEAIKLAEDMAKVKTEQTTDAYNKAIGETKTAYESEYQKNAVQKLINERTIAEKNANLGLSDSGLNRTQLTANQLSYANQKGNIDLTRQKAITTLETNLANAIAEIKQENEQNKMSINQSYDQYNDQLASSLYSADLERQQAAYQNAIIAEQNELAEYENIDFLTYAGVDKDTDKCLYYNEEGELLSFDKGINPYTGTVNPDVANGTFANGYQPDNYNGQKLEKTASTSVMYGKEVPIYKNEYGVCMMWDEIYNVYRSVEKEGEDKSLLGKLSYGINNILKTVTG